MGRLLKTMSRRTQLLMLGVAIVALVAVNLLFSEYSVFHELADRPARVPVVERFGPEAAEIEIVAYFHRPTADADDTLDLLDKLITEYEPHMRVTAVNTGTDQGLARRRAAALAEDGITINGRNSFSRVVSNELRKVQFLEAVYPTGSRWREPDLRAFVVAELEHMGLDAKKARQALAQTKTGQTYSLGNPEAKVRVKAYYPMPEECVDVTCEILKNVAQEYKDRVYFEFIDTCSDDGFTEWTEAHTICHGILINGKQECEVTLNGEARKVTFFAPVDTEWTQAALAYALDAELQAARGE